MKNFKSLILVIVVSLSTVTTTVWSQCATPDPIDTKAVIGEWNGSYSSDGKFLDMTLTLSESNGVIAAAIDIPSVKAKSVKYDVRICKSQELHLTKQDGDMLIEFRGTPIDGKISGKVIFSQNESVIGEEVFTLKRTSGGVASR